MIPLPITTGSISNATGSTSTAIGYTYTKPTTTMGSSSLKSALDTVKEMKAFLQAPERKPACETKGGEVDACCDQQSVRLSFGKIVFERWNIANVDTEYRQIKHHPSQICKTVESQ